MLAFLTLQCRSPHLVYLHTDFVEDLRLSKESSFVKSKIDADVRLSFASDMIHLSLLLR